jgi:hypothetical protein
LWRHFIEEVKGKYIVANGGLTVSNIEDRYNNFNGTWND